MASEAKGDKVDRRMAELLRDFQDLAVSELHKSTSHINAADFGRLYANYQQMRKDEKQVARRQEQILFAPLLWLLTQDLPEKMTFVEFTAIYHEMAECIAHMLALVEPFANQEKDVQ
jgi:hypothetical protein